MKGKMDDLFKEKGKIICKISENIYKVENEGKKIIIKHSFQLKEISWELKERSVGSE